jgi:hypothetical protein
MSGATHPVPGVGNSTARGAHGSTKSQSVLASVCALASRQAADDTSSASTARREERGATDKAVNSAGYYDSTHLAAMLAVKEPTQSSQPNRLPRHNARGTLGTSCMRRHGGGCDHNRGCGHTSVRFSAVASPAMCSRGCSRTWPPASDGGTPLKRGEWAGTLCAWSAGPPQPSRPDYSRSRTVSDTASSTCESLNGFSMKTKAPASSVSWASVSML